MDDLLRPATSTEDPQVRAREGKKTLTHIHIHKAHTLSSFFKSLHRTGPPPRPRTHRQEATTNGLWLKLRHNSPHLIDLWNREGKGASLSFNMRYNGPNELIWGRMLSTRLFYSLAHLVGGLWVLCAWFCLFAHLLRDGCVCCVYR
jgi:hypothetical protein